MQRPFRISSCLWAGILFSPICGFTQNAVSTGALSGTCRDPQGLALQNVDVELSKESTGLHEKTLTNAEGVYLFSDLSIGRYEVTFSLAAFRTADLPDVEVTVGHTTNADVALQLGAVSDKVIVEAAGTTLNPTDTNPSTVIEKRFFPRAVLGFRHGNRHRNQQSEPI
jgi:Carboxypeptidase regulatory-like domain